jgi:hypothetical protein
MNTTSIKNNIRFWIGLIAFGLLASNALALTVFDDRGAKGISTQTVVCFCQTVSGLAPITVNKQEKGIIKIGKIKYEN